MRRPLAVKALVIVRLGRFPQPTSVSSWLRTGTTGVPSGSGSALGGWRGALSGGMVFIIPRQSHVSYLGAVKSRPASKPPRTVPE